MYAVLLGPIAPMFFTNYFYPTRSSAEERKDLRRITNTSPSELATAGSHCQFYVHFLVLSMTVVAWTSSCCSTSCIFHTTAWTYLTWKQKHITWRSSPTTPSSPTREKRRVRLINYEDALHPFFING